MTAATSYRLVLPRPWERISLGSDTAGQVTALVDRTVERLPKELPPDQVGPARRRLEQLLRDQLREAEDKGGVDFYLPTDMVDGLVISASFVVSIITPSAAPSEGRPEDVLAHLLSTREGSEPVSVGDTVWVRAEGVFDRAADETIGQDVGVRKVDYVTAIPADTRRWVVVAFTTVGDGDPRGGYADLLVELFDAIMSTWRWVAA